MLSPSLALLMLIARFCTAQEFPDYVEFQGNRSAPDNVSPAVRKTLLQADSNPNASHTVRFSSPGSGDWDWTLQLSDVNVPGISKSTPSAHIAFTTYHFSRTDKGPMPDKRAENSPMCAYLMNIQFPLNVSSQWDDNSSSCESALGRECASYLGSVYVADNCDAGNLPSLIGVDACRFDIDGASQGLTTHGLQFQASDALSGDAWAYALSRPYEEGNGTLYKAAEDQLRILVLSGPGGSEAFCNRVARTVDTQGDQSGSGGAQGGGDDTESDESDSSDGNDNNESGAASSHVSGFAGAAVACGLVAWWL